MMETTRLRDKSRILSFLMKDPDIQYYCIGDLDDFFWPHTEWWALVNNDEIRSIALLYSGGATPALLMFHNGDQLYPAELLDRIKDTLPTVLYAHLSPGLIDHFRSEEINENYGLHYKMILRHPAKEVDDSNIRRLSASDLKSIAELYSVAYPGNWFDKRMLQTGKYFGYYIDSRLAGISGIHVYSPEFRVAALGNIATHPDYRGRGIAYKLTVRLYNDLLKNTQIIGLNVRSDNDHAINCYKKAGFGISGTYDECLIVKNLSGNRI